MIPSLSFHLHCFLKKSRWDSGIPPTDLINVLEKRPPAGTWDLGCGTGTNAITSQQYGCKQVGIDISSLAIREARRKAKLIGAKVHFPQGEAVKMEGVESTFDLNLDTCCFHAIQPALKFPNPIGKDLHPGKTFLPCTLLEEDIQGERSLSPEDTLLRVFGTCCPCFGVTRGSDRTSPRPSAWLAFRRGP